MYLLRSVFVIMVFSLIACKASKVSNANGTNVKTGAVITNSCDQTIRYFASRLSDPKGGQEITANTEIIINPSTKVITLTSEPPDQEKTSFDTMIESFDCNLNSDLTEGQSIYNANIQRPDGTTSKVTIKVEAKDGQLTIASVNPDDDGIIIHVSKWEVVKE